MPRPMPAPPRVQPFRRVPAAIFPPVLGLLGLAMAWRSGVAVFGLPAAPAELLAGIATAVFGFCLAAYAVKLALRPAVLAGDLATLPGRTGIAALAVALMVEAALLAPLAALPARAALALGATAFVALAAHALRQRILGADTTGPATPALHLVFVGIVVAPGAAVPLGMAPAIIPWLVWYCALAALLITALTGRALLARQGAPALRPLQTIHLAPPAFVATGAFLTGQAPLAWTALGWTALVFGVLAARARWMTEGGFGPFWSAFTFPASAFAGALLAGARVSGSPTLRAAGALALVTATLIVLPVLYRVLRLWASGMLAERTNAATA